MKTVSAAGTHVNEVAGFFEVSAVMKPEDTSCHENYEPI
jgi:hypothetical protein